MLEDAITQGDLDELERHCDSILSEKKKLAYDWAWDVNEAKDERSFRIVQSSPTLRRTGLGRRTTGGSAISGSPSPAPAIPGAAGPAMTAPRRG